MNTDYSFRGIDSNSGKLQKTETGKIMEGDKVISKGEKTERVAFVNEGKVYEIAAKAIILKESDKGKNKVPKLNFIQRQFFVLYAHTENDTTTYYKMNKNSFINRLGVDKNFLSQELKLNHGMLTKTSIQHIFGEKKVNEFQKGTNKLHLTKKAEVNSEKNTAVASPLPEKKVSKDGEKIFREGLRKKEESSYKEALNLFTEGKALSHAPSICELGVMHQLGLGVPKDGGKAVNLYREAAKLGNAKAQFRLGAIYDSIDDKLEAEKFYTQAANNTTLPRDDESIDAAKQKLEVILKERQKEEEDKDKFELM
jgi:tetratricopeptide (TPR) repeat protein